MSASFSTAESHQIDRFVLEILDPHTVAELSVGQVTRSSISYDDRNNTVFDPKFGAVGYAERCVTCNSDINNCVGHFGHIDLALPFYQPFFLTTIYKTIQKSCWSCYYPLNGTNCGICGKKQGKWSRDGVYKDKIAHRCGSVKKEYTSTDIQQILKKHDEKFKPDQPMSWLITTVLPVLPPCSRPSILNKGNWCHNSLSHCYSNVVKENNVLNVFLQQNQASHIINQQWRRVQDQIYKIYDVKNVTETAYMEGIRQRLDGKQGRMRKNLVGKFCYCFFVFVFVFVYLFFLLYPQANA